MQNKKKNNQVRHLGLPGNNIEILKNEKKLKVT